VFWNSLIFLLYRCVCQASGLLCWHHLMLFFNTRVLPQLVGCSLFCCFSTAILVNVGRVCAAQSVLYLSKAV
jgi:hypothetical protein